MVWWVWWYCVGSSGYIWFRLVGELWSASKKSPRSVFFLFKSCLPLIARPQLRSARTAALAELLRPSSADLAQAAAIRIRNSQSHVRAEDGTQSWR
ncbi:hypothetical protein QBC34DRAFT_414915 [Podospora aff. communis PSN243]|uniref:Secreted protein n=1 Tax=Podospora aff. communis PSN243 TaxID=3040156 RepID=A0AAV9GAH8_9PEZI|nr:hypothetical protein QBC34DRAFT_414915 [Podospora aff. communis PSN243]